MKTYLTLFIVACQSLAAFAQDYDSKTPYLTKSLANDAISSVVVSTSAGGITVSGEAAQSPRIEVYIKGNNNDELTKAEIEKRLNEDYDMNVAVNGHELTATVKHKHDFQNWRKQLTISFKIYVPQHVSTDLTTSGGGIRLDNLTGKETFRTSGGGLNLTKLSGVINGHTSGGGIEITDSNEDINLTTSGGGITAKHCDGKIRLVTSGGGLRLENLKGTITAHTSGGGVEGSYIEGELITGTSGGGIDLAHMNCSLDANTSAGSLNAQMEHVGSYLKLHTSAGNIDLQLPAKQGFDFNMRGESVGQAPAGFNGEWKKGHVNGSINGGGTEVSASASSGDVNVKFN